MDRALIVDDIAAGREIVGKVLCDAGFSIEIAVDANDASELFERVKFDLVVADHRPPGVDAIDLVRRIRRVSDAPIVVLAAIPSIDDCEQAIRAGADRFLRLSNDVERLGNVAREILTVQSGRSRADGTVVTREEARAIGQRELRSLLQRLLIECRGNIAEIARRMNRDRSTIRYHLRRMDMLE
jgi:DNA-binding NtrC family response regulator